jgi:hypothetical protein
MLDWRCSNAWRDQGNGHHAVVGLDDGVPTVLGCFECDWAKVADKDRCVAGVVGWGYSKPSGARCSMPAVYGSHCARHQDLRHGLWEGLYREFRSPCSELELPEAYRQVFIRAIRDAQLVADEGQVGREMFVKAKELRERSVVYFVEREGLIKIGVTRNLTKRVQSIGKGSSMPPGMTVGPVELLATMPGDRRDEEALHQRFRKQRIPKTEWFRPSKALWHLIEDLQRAESRGTPDVLDEVLAQAA